MSGPVGGDAWSRMSRRWDWFFGVTATAVAVAVAAGDLPVARRAAAVGAILAVAVLYVAAGRRLLNHERPARGSAVAGLAVLFFAAGTYADTTVSYLLFGLCPLIFLMLPLRPAVLLVVLANLVPLATGLVQGGFQLGAAARLGPIFVMAAALSVWLGVWINQVIGQSRERADLIASLEQSRAEVARLSHEAGVAAERTRLAGEIHDTLAQGFTSIITLLQAADPELSDERLALAVRTARENLAESRALIAALTPSALGSGSLIDAVRRQASRFTSESGIPATFRTSGDPRPLPTAVEVVLLRAAQEALTNVRRHAHAQEAGVLLAYGSASTRLVVRDDGVGFDPASAAGFGLDGMRARTGQVDGRLTVHSDPDTGTTIELEVPA